MPHYYELHKDLSKGLFYPSFNFYRWILNIYYDILISKRFRSDNFFFYFIQGLNPGLAIGEIKKMLAKYNSKEAKQLAQA